MPRFIILDSDTHPQDVPFFYKILESSLFHVLGLVVTPSLYNMSQAYAHAHLLKKLNHAPISIHLGADRGIMGPFPQLQSLEGYALPLPIKTVEKQSEGAFFLVDALLKSLAPVTLVVLGPLTNLALALVINPKIREKISEIIVVGGTLFKDADATPFAESRFLADPHAVSIVLSSHVPLVFFPTDLTRHFVPDLNWLQHWFEFLDPSWEKSFMALAQYPSFPSLAALSYLENKESLGQCRHVFSTIETREGILKGKLTVDWWHKLSDAPNVYYYQGDIGDMQFSKCGLESIFSGSLPAESEAA